MKIDQLQKADFDQILGCLDEFWGGRSPLILSLHHPMFVYEFGDTAFVIKDQGDVAAYLMGFILPEKKLGYIHLVAIKPPHRKRGLASDLYRHFFELTSRRGGVQVKAITSPSGLQSIAFHRSLGFELQGEPNGDGIPVIKNYRGPGEDRVVFLKRLG